MAGNGRSPCLKVSEETEHLNQLKTVAGVLSLFLLGVCSITFPQLSFETSHPVEGFFWISLFWTFLFFSILLASLYQKRHIRKIYLRDISVALVLPHSLRQELAQNNQSIDFLIKNITQQQQKISGHWPHINTALQTTLSSFMKTYYEKLTIQQKKTLKWSDYSIGKIHVNHLFLSLGIIFIGIGFAIGPLKFFDAHNIFLGVFMSAIILGASIPIFDFILDKIEWNRSLKEFENALLIPKHLTKHLQTNLGRQVFRKELYLYLTILDNTSLDNTSQGIQYA